MPALDIDREAAREAAERELDRPIYPRASLSDRVAEWLNDLLYRLMHGGAELPGGWLSIVVLGLLVLAAAIGAIGLARRTLGRRGAERLHEGRMMTSADHRARAERAAAGGDFSTAIRQRVRALGRLLEENGVLDPVPGRTADELAAEAGARLPDVAAALAEAATVFDDVTYGARAGAESDYRRIADLDHRISRTTGSVDATPGAR